MCTTGRSNNSGGRGVFFQGEGLIWTSGFTLVDIRRAKRGPRVLTQSGPELQNHICLSAGRQVGSETSTRTTSGCICRLKSSRTPPHRRIQMRCRGYAKPGVWRVALILLKSAEFSQQPYSRCRRIWTSFSVSVCRGLQQMERL